MWHRGNDVINLAHARLECCEITQRLGLRIYSRSSATKNLWDIKIAEGFTAAATCIPVYHLRFKSQTSFFGISLGKLRLAPCLLLSGRVGTGSKAYKGILQARSSYACRPSPVGVSCLRSGGMQPLPYWSPTAPQQVRPNAPMQVQLRSLRVLEETINLG